MIAANNLFMPCFFDLSTDPLFTGRRTSRQYPSAYIYYCVRGTRRA